METLFTKIINGEIPSYKVAEDAYSFAFLDINPNTKGHVLCVPRRAVDKIFDLAEEDYQQLMSFSRRVALAMRTVVSCKRIVMSIIGLEVPHAHVHLIPIEKMGDASFQNKTEVSAEEMKSIADQIAHAFDELA